LFCNDVVVNAEKKSISLFITYLIYQFIFSETKNWLSWTKTYYKMMSSKIMNNPITQQASSNA